MAACEMLDKCGFFNKYRDSLDMACRGFINHYCEAGLTAECRRFQFRQEQGASPPDDMLPSGQMLSEGTLRALGHVPCNLPSSVDDEGES